MAAAGRVSGAGTKRGTSIPLWGAEYQRSPRAARLGYGRRPFSATFSLASPASRESPIVEEQEKKFLHSRPGRGVGGTGTVRQAAFPSLGHREQSRGRRKSARSTFCLGLFRLAYIYSPAQPSRPIRNATWRVVPPFHPPTDYLIFLGNDALRLPKQWLRQALGCAESTISWSSSFFRGNEHLGYLDAFGVWFWSVPSSLEMWISPKHLDGNQAAYLYRKPFYCNPLSNNLFQFCSRCAFKRSLYLGQLQASFYFAASEWGTDQGNNENWCSVQRLPQQLVMYYRRGLQINSPLHMPIPQTNKNSC